MAAKKKAKQAPIENATFENLGDLIGDLTNTGTNAADVKGYIHTGSRGLDWALTNGSFRGGYPQGRMIELYGGAAAGKTSAATHALISCQRGSGVAVDWVETDGVVRPVPSDRELQPGLAILIDSEAKFDIQRATQMGLDAAKLHRIQGNADKPLTVESMIETLTSILDRVAKMEDFTSGRRPVVIVVDSISAAATEDEFEGNALAGGIASKPRMVRAALRKMTGRFADLNVTAFFVSHVGANIGSVGTTPTGSGKAIGYFASLRFNLKKGYKGSQNLDIHEAGKQVGITTQFNCTKSSVSVPFVEPINVPNVWLSGFSEQWEVLRFLKDNKNDVLSQSGAWIKVQMPDGTEVSKYEKDLIAAMREDKELSDHLLAEFDKLNKA